MLIKRKHKFQVKISGAHTIFHAQVINIRKPKTKLLSKHIFLSFWKMLLIV